ncbi:MAG: SDR family NAD(P)-dependent oxidoreductase [Salibacteraceae bacterium]
MSNQVCTVIGTAYNSGLQLAREYAEDGFHIALVGINRDTLDRYRAELDRMGAKVTTYHHNYLEGDQQMAMTEVFRRIRKEQGTVKALVFNESVYSESFAGPGTGQNPYYDIRLICTSAMAAAGQVIPSMTKNHQGALHFTGPEFNQQYFHGQADQACQMARDLVQNLCMELYDQQIQVWETGEYGPNNVMSYFQGDYDYYRGNTYQSGNQNFNSYRSSAGYNNWNPESYQSDFRQGYRYGQRMEPSNYRNRQSNGWNYRSYTPGYWDMNPQNRNWKENYRPWQRTNGSFNDYHRGREADYFPNNWNDYSYSQPTADWSNSFRHPFPYSYTTPSMSYNQGAPFQSAAVFPYQNMDFNRWGYRDSFYGNPDNRQDNWSAKKRYFRSQDQGYGTYRGARASSNVNVNGQAEPGFAMAS